MPSGTLTPAARRILGEVRRDGQRRYNARAWNQITALEAAGLVDVDWDADMDEAKGRLRWRIAVRPRPRTVDETAELLALVLVAAVGADGAEAYARHAPVLEGGAACS